MEQHPEILDQHKSSRLNYEFPAVFTAAGF